MIDHEGAQLFLDIAAANIHDSHLLEPIILLLKMSQKARILAGDTIQIRSVCARLSPPSPCKNDTNQIIGHIEDG